MSVRGHAPSPIAWPIPSFVAAPVAARRAPDDAVRLGQSALLSRACRPPTPRYFDVDADARVLAHCHWQAGPWEHPTIVALHGLNGSSDAHYMRGIAAKAFARGMNVVRLNQRNCGGTEHLSAGLFHSGPHRRRPARDRRAHRRSTACRSIAVAGYSLGGNLALKLAGEYGDAPPSALMAVAAVSPILEICECVHALERPGNWLYQWNFVRDLKARMRRKDRLWPGLFDLSKLEADQDGARSSTRSTPRRTSASPDAEDYYHRPARCASSTGSACRR